MLFNLVELRDDRPHAWAVVHCNCTLSSTVDPLLLHAVDLLRNAYGEDAVVSLAHPDPGVEASFDLTAITAAVRRGLPDPDAEKGKPQRLANYRSEPAELLAQGGLSSAYGVQFPAAPQRGKTNANQPILGFDAWGVLEMDTAQPSLVLVQVKGTEETVSPPSIAETLADECCRVPKDIDAICRALTVLVLAVQDQPPMVTAILAMLEQLGQGSLPKLVVAPAIVRGSLAASMSDLDPIKAKVGSMHPAACKGLALSVSVPLTEFGRTVTTMARGS